LKRVVLDTNVTIAALFWKGYPREVYDLIRERKLSMLLSKDMEAELIRVLGYTKFGLLPNEIIPIIMNIKGNAEPVEIKNRLSLITSDPTDNIFLDCAADGHADYIISGDRHLLELGSFQNIQITKAKEFLIKGGFVTEG
jgi:uncharacterized protein